MAQGAGRAASGISLGNTGKAGTFMAMVSDPVKKDGYTVVHNAWYPSVPVSSLNVLQSMGQIVATGRAATVKCLPLGVTIP